MTSEPHPLTLTLIECHRRRPSLPIRVILGGFQVIVGSWAMSVLLSWLAAGALIWVFVQLLA